MNVYEIEVLVKQTVQVQAESHEAAAAAVRGQHRSGEVMVLRSLHIGMAARTGLTPPAPPVHLGMPAANTDAFTGDIA